MGTFKIQSHHDRWGWVLMTTPSDEAEGRRKYEMYRRNFPKSTFRLVEERRQSGRIDTLVILGPRNLLRAK